MNAVELEQMLEQMTFWETVTYFPFPYILVLMVLLVSVFVWIMSTNDLKATVRAQQALLERINAGFHISTELNAKRREIAEREQELETQPFIASVIDEKRRELQECRNRLAQFEDHIRTAGYGELLEPRVSQQVATGMNALARSRYAPEEDAPSSA